MPQRDRSGRGAGGWASQAAASAAALNESFPTPLLDERLEYIFGGHLAIEYGIVMVIARRRLSANDVRRISHGMKARRGAHCR
jgi:hypothetical protein